VILGGVIDTRLECLLLIQDTEPKLYSLLDFVTVVLVVVALLVVVLLSFWDVIVKKEAYY
jgi:hypothetical protein